MPKTLSRNDPHRKQFEITYGKTIRHNYWLQICREMQAAGLKVDMKSVAFYATFKKHHRRKPLIKEVVEKLTAFVNEYDSSAELLGREIAALIKQNSNLTDNAIYKCFHKAGFSFCRDTQYSFNTAYQILTFAYTIRPKKEAGYVK